MVGGEDQDILLLFENIHGQGAENTLGPDLDKYPRSGLVQGVDPLDELDG